MLGMSAEEVRKICEGTLTVQDRRRVARNAVDSVAPARREPGASIEMTVGVISDAAVRETPSPELMEQVQPAEVIVKLRAAEVQIRALDLDSGRRGWAAVIPDLSSRRVSLRVVPGIDLEQLAQERL